jgi:hypothetical protein
MIVAAFIAYSFCLALLVQTATADIAIYKRQL